MPAAPPTSPAPTPPATTKEAAARDQTPTRNQRTPIAPSMPQPNRNAQRIAAGAADAEQETVIIPRRESVSAARLQRLQPAGRSDIIVLDRVTYLLGRSHAANITLFSPTAGREHAQLTNRDRRWYITPTPAHGVLVNGVAAHGETALTHKARLRFGDDEFLFLDETALAEPPPVVRALRYGKLSLAVIVLLLIAVIAAGVWWLRANP